MSKDVFLYYCCLALFFLDAVWTLSNETLDHPAESYSNASIGSALWDTFLGDCKRPSFACMRKTFDHYLDDTFNYPNDIDFGGYLKLTKNKFHFDESNQIEEVQTNETNVESGSRLLSALDEMSGTFRSKLVKFMMTHDVELHLPEILFDGGVFRISPRSIEGDGTIVKLNILPGQLTSTNGEGRILLKKLRDWIGEKLLFALLAILVVIKLLAVKFLFLLPMVMGVAAAKKLLLKLVLFVFPFLSHIFKLCPYVPHGTKYHKHQHLIKHFHHVSPHAPQPPHGHHGHHDGIEIIAPHAGGPPSLHHHLDHDIKDHHPHYNPHENDLGFYSDGPSYVHEFITHRKTDKNTYGDDYNEVSPWGQGQAGLRPKKPADTGRPLTPSEIEKMVAKAEKEAMIKARLQQEQIRVQAENLRLQEQIRKAMKLQEKLRLQSMMVTGNLKLPGANSLTGVKTVPLAQPGSFLKAPDVQASASTQVQQLKPVTEPKLPSLPLYDAFYSPILEKIDKILVGLGFTEEPCRERLICSMYKNPTKFSPHSNLLSAELSRDSSELQKPTSTNAAVIRFYKYVQSARDGQDKRDCLRLYPSCSINTEL